MAKPIDPLPADKQPKKNEQGKMLTNKNGFKGNEQVRKGAPRGKSDWNQSFDKNSQL